MSNLMKLINTRHVTLGQLTVWTGLCLLLLATLCSFFFFGSSLDCLDCSSIDQLCGIVADFHVSSQMIAWYLITGLLTLSFLPGFLYDTFPLSRLVFQQYDARSLSAAYGRGTSVYCRIQSFLL